MAKFKKRMRKWFNVDGPAADTSTVYDADYTDDDDDFNDDLEEAVADNSIASRLRRLRRAIDPKGKSEDNFADEVKVLADKVGAPLPTGSTRIDEQVAAVEDFYFGKGNTSKRRKKGHSAPGWIDEMAEDLKVTVAPDAAPAQKLEAVERNLGKDPTVQSTKSFEDRIVECYIDLYGYDPRG